MGSRRRYLFVLLFVLGLVAVSAIVIASKPTKLGLDLQGGLELVYQGQPTGKATSVSGEDIEDSISIIEQRINKLGVSEPEVARLGTDEITVSLPGIKDANRAAEQVGTTAQLYFYDWEPNLIGPERAIGGHPGQQPPAGPLKASEKRWEEAGRNVKSAENKQLIFSGAYPDAYSAALLASEQEADPNCENCSVAKPRFYLFDKKDPGEPLAGPEQAKKDLYISPTGEEAAQGWDRARNPGGNRPRLRIPDRRIGPGRQDRQAGLVRAEGRPGALRDRHHRTRTGLRPVQRTDRHLRLYRQGPRSLPRTSPGRSPSAGRRRRSARPRVNRPRRSPATSRSSSTTKSRPARSSTSPRTPTGSTAATAPRSPAASKASPRPRNWRRRCRSARCRSA